MERINERQSALVRQFLTQADDVKYYLYHLNYPVLSEEELRELYDKFQHGDLQARDTIIQCNLKLVVYLAKNCDRRGVPLADLIQEGNIALMNAVDSFDIKKGYQFSTYAAKCVKQRINNTIAILSHDLHIPRSRMKDYSRMSKALKELGATLDHEPTVSEIAEKLGWKMKEVEDMIGWSQKSYSLNTLVPQLKNEVEQIEIVADDHCDIPRTINDKSLKENITNILSMVSMDKREREILMKRFGIGDYEAKTLDELSKEYGVARERIRQIEHKAILKIRKSHYLYLFAELLDIKDDAREVEKNFQIKMVIDKNKETGKISRDNLYVYCHEKYGYTLEELQDIVANLPSGVREFTYWLYGEDLLGTISKEDRRLFTQLQMTRYNYLFVLLNSSVRGKEWNDSERVLEYETETRRKNKYELHIK